MNMEHIKTRRSGDMLEIVLDRGEKGNSLTREMGDAIVAALAGVDDSVKLVVLSATGPDFCAGRDSPMPTLGPKPNAETIRQAVALPPLALYDAVKAVPVPVIAVVRGRAVGAGCALACVADITLAASDAVFQVPEMERDIPPTLVMAALADRVPVKTLAWMVYSRLALDAGQARAAGLVQEVVAPDELDAAVASLTATMLSNTPVSLRAVKQFLSLAPQMPPPAASGLAAHLVSTALAARF
ncbi:MAG: enoyl-CoA hydratase [Paucimonas sp.]|nr:enoyl-CoA hydratase [Paucimonas sp.]